MSIEKNIFELIQNDYSKYTLSEKKVIDYVLDHKQEVQFMSISELADACSVGDATISRFCRKLKLRSYNDFKLNIAKSLSSNYYPLKDTSGSNYDDTHANYDNALSTAKRLMSSYTAALNHTISLIDEKAIIQATDILENASRVYCMGQGGSMILSHQAQHLFSTVSQKFIFVPDSHLQTQNAAIMGPSDAILYMSYSGSTSDIVDLMKLAHKGGAKIVLITRYLRSPGAMQADVVLQCGSNESPLEMGSVSAKFAQLFILDLLFQCFYQRNISSFTDAHDRITNALAERHI